jgi:flagellar hook-associated protein 3 FlgL
MDNLDGIVSMLELSSTIIQDIVSYCTDVRVRVTQVAGGIYDEDTQKRVADGIDDILEQMVSLANTNHMNRYLFGGSSTTTAPYVVERTEGEITGVTYQGSSEDLNVEVAPGVEASAFYIGDNIFRSDSRDEPVFIGDTGAKAGTGTSSVSGFTWLTVTDEDGDGTYELSIDDGLSTVVADGSNNMAVTDSRTGRVLYVDTTELNNTGVELVSVPGTHNIFDVLITIRDIFKNERGLSSGQIEQMRSNALGALEEATNLLVQTSVSMGSKIGFLDDLKQSLQSLKYNTEDESAGLEQADIAQLATDLSRREVLYQMSLSVAARMMSLSLFDFLE